MPVTSLAVAQKEEEEEEEEKFRFVSFDDETDEPEETEFSENRHNDTLSSSLGRERVVALPPDVIDIFTSRRIIIRIYRIIHWLSRVPSVGFQFLPHWLRLISLVNWLLELIARRAASIESRLELDFTSTKNGAYETHN